MSKSRTEINASYYTRHRDKEIVRSLARYKKVMADPSTRAAFVERVREYDAARYIADKETIKARARRNHLAYAYGMTEAARDAMAVAQGGACAICDYPLMKGSGTHVDHDHQTGQVRGLLCVRCNQGLGLFRDSIDHLASAIEYLQKAQCSQLTLVKKEIM